MKSITKYLDQYAANFTSKWVVLVIDCFLVAVSYLLSLAVRFNFIYEQEVWGSYLPKFLLIEIVFFCGFLFFKSYIGVIRHTSLVDARRIVLSTAFSTFLLIIFNVWLRDREIGQITSFLYLPFSIISIHFLLVNFILLSSRMVFKMVYFKLAMRNISGGIKKVAIFGAGQAGIITLNVLRNDQSFVNKVVSFFDDNDSKRGTSISGVPVFSFEESFLEVVEKHDLSYVVLAIQGVSVKRKRQIVDTCIELNIDVKIIPPVNDWVNGELNSKQIKDVRMVDLLGRDPIKLDIENVTREIQGKTVLVTGAAGSIGSEIAKQAYNYKPKHLILLDQAETPIYELQYDLKRSFGEEALSLCSTIICDVYDRDSLETVFEEYDIDLVYHAAAYKHVPLMEENPGEGIKTNVLGTRNCADLSLKYDVDKFVMVSTDKAVNPTNVMGATKRVAEKCVCSRNGKGKTRFITTRFGNVLGSNGSVIPLFRKQIENGGPVMVTHPDITRYFMTIPEACQLVLEAGAMGDGGEVFVFDMGESVKIFDVAKKMIKLAGLELDKDIKIKFIGLRPGEKLYEELLTTKENCIDTHHPKIMRARIEDCESIEVLNNQLSELEELTRSRKKYKESVKVLKLIVPEYKSNNSVYEELDNK